VHPQRSTRPVNKKCQVRFVLKGQRVDGRIDILRLHSDDLEGLVRAPRVLRVKIAEDSALKVWERFPWPQVGGTLQ